MPDSGYFTELRRFLMGHQQQSRHTSRGARRRRSPSRNDTIFTLESLESRVLLAADLAAAATQVIEPMPTEPQPAAVFLLDRETGTNGSVVQERAYGNLPLSFEANMGQSDSEVSYLARGDGYSLFLTGDGAMLSLQQEDGSVPAVLSMEMVGANADALITGEQLLPGVANYFIGDDPSQWRTEIPTYAQVQYDEIYTGIDLLYYGNQGQLEYDFEVAPGADPGTIQLRFTGADHIALNQQGDLLLQIRDEQLTVQKPVLYQSINGERQEISGSFVVHENGTVKFDVGGYDQNQPLIIDPVLVYSTYLGGNQGDWGNGVQVDASGQAYITGRTASSTFPLVNSIQNQADFDGQAFVTKLNAAGTAVLYSTYIGGSGPDEGLELALDAAGNMYVGGLTSGPDFPTTSGAFQRTFGGGIDGFITKLNPTGSALVYSTYVGGSGLDQVNGIAVNTAGQLYAVGQTTSSNYPITPEAAFQTANAGGFDAFVTSLNADGSVYYSTYLGGVDTDLGNAIAVDGTGQAYLTGVTVGRGRIFPTTPGAFQETGPQFGIWQEENAFVTKLNPTGTRLEYSTILAGTSLDVGNGIAVDSSGHAYVAGATDSFNFPLTSGAFQTSGPTDPGTGGTTRKGFVTKVNPAGSGLVYSTYLGGSGSNELSAIRTDTEGNMYVTGFTRSADYPITSDALQAGHGSGGQGGDRGSQQDAIVTVLNPLNPPNSALVYSSYLGGNAGDAGHAIALDSPGNIYVTGFTGSPNFPTSANFPSYPPENRPSFQASAPGNGDAFVTKIALTQPNQAPVANADTYSVDEDTTLTVPARGVPANDTDADNNPLTAALVTGPANGTLTLNADGGFTYTPNANFNGSESFTYKANDGNADSNVATVSISVNSVNDPPTAVNDTATVAEDSGPTAIPVLDNDSVAPDTGETLTIIAVTQGSNGAVAITGNGTGLTYRPNDNFAGTDTFTYTVTDGNGGTARATVGMTIRSVNDPPIAKAGLAQTVEATSPTGAQVTLNGSGSSDPDGDPLTYNWAGSFGTATGPTPTVTLPLGKHSITLTVADGKGESASDKVIITVQDTTKPTLTSLRATPNRLSPPNHQMVSVTISAVTSDSADPTVPYRIIAVSSNEPIDGLGDGDRAPDWDITGERTVDLRAERSGSGNGRVYTITVEAVDDSGNRATNTVTVTVPRR